MGAKFNNAMGVFALVAVAVGITATVIGALVGPCHAEEPPLGGEDGHVERDFYDPEGYVIKDRQGRVQGRVEPDPYDDDDYVIRDNDGRVKGRLEACSNSPYGC